MRILGIGCEHDLADMYLALSEAGHAVRVYVGEPACHDIFAGTLTRVTDWREHLEWARDGIIVFENADLGETQDALRRDGWRVVGGSALGDRLEGDRNFGQATLAKLGLGTSRTERFTDPHDAIRFVRAHPRRYVLKPNGTHNASHLTYVGRREDGGDVIARLMRYPVDDFVLMHFVDGVEVGVGGWFDGHDFVGHPNLDWEHKRLFAGDIGELTGEMGTVATYRGAERLFDATLARLAPELRAAHHVGYVNLNMIVNEAGITPLELTMRFGYPGYAVLAALQVTHWGRWLERLTMPRAPDGTASLPTVETREGVSVGIVISVPPFPYAHGYEVLGKGMPVLLEDTPRDALHLTEARYDDGMLVTAGATGYLGVVTGTGPTLAAARRAAYANVATIAVPDLRYRHDIGERLARHDAKRLHDLGWIGDATCAALVDAP